MFSVAIGLMLASIVFAWLHWQRLAIVSVFILLLFGTIFGIFSSSALIATCILGLLVYLFGQNLNNKLVARAVAVLMIVLTIAMSLHKIPGFQNILAFDQVVLSPLSKPFTMYINFDKPMFAIFYLIVFAPLITLQSTVKNTVIALAKSLFPLLICIVPLGLFVGYLKLDLKIPSEIGLWSANNLLITCVGEEVFFRGFIQNRLSAKLVYLKYGQIAALFLTSLLFGFAHFAGGLSYVGLATIAGGFYGLAYLRTKSLEAPVLCHFGLNLVHFLFFTYPSAI